MVFLRAWRQRLQGVRHRLNQGLQRVESIHNRLGGLETKLDGISSKDDDSGSRFDLLEAKLDHIGPRLDRLASRLDRMWDHVDTIRNNAGVYLGDGIALTQLIDETRFIVNANDYGGPVNYISGGRYEEENLDVLLSFVHDRTVFLDIGANLGFFAVLIANRLRRGGTVLAFEPHPRLAELARQNAMINGLDHVVTVHPHGLSDKAMDVSFSYPKGHLGGGSIGIVDDADQFDIVRSSVRPLDDVVGPDFRADLVKIDVEGHELSVLNGMLAIIRRSPDIKIMFEKLGTHVGSEAGLEAFFADLGFDLHAVEGDASLRPLQARELASFSGYGFACRPGVVTDLSRARFSIHPSQFMVPGMAQPGLGERLTRTADPGTLLFFGPYWFLRRGVWDLRLHGSFSGRIDVTVAERYGHATQTVSLREGNNTVRFTNDRDLTKFELIAHAVGDGPVTIDLERVELIRVG